MDLIETVTDGLWQWSGAATFAQFRYDGHAWIKLPTGGEADVVVSCVRSISSADHTLQLPVAEALT
ncbi:hypothetical protein [Amycolatopsis sp. NPDC021455]|uniref:hypothetical protein n=1 Tax=Amycolatopsis sp. NPDC021455 TaxID=3154901 RepID=UPI0033E84B2B